jgi:hypothetical protein
MFKQYDNKMMAAPENKAWHGERVIVAGSGPSLTKDVAHTVRMTRWFKGWRVLAVSDAYRLLPFADALYACDWAWWRKHDGAKGFLGERYTSHSIEPGLIDDKSGVVHEYPGIQLVRAADRPGFGTKVIHYGFSGSSGHQAVNLALNMGASQIVLVGFDYRHVDGKSHFFGDHEGLRQSSDTDYRALASAFKPHDLIVNATPGSAIDAYPMMSLEDAIADRVYRDRAEPHAAADRHSAA